MAVEQRRRSDAEKCNVVVPVNLRVTGDEGEAFAARLGNQHAIERVAVQEREPAGVCPGAGSLRGEAEVAGDRVVDGRGVPVVGEAEPPGE